MLKMNKIKYSIVLVSVVAVAVIFVLSRILQPTDNKQVSSFRSNSVELPKKNSLLRPIELSKKNKLIQTVLDIPRFQILCKSPLLKLYTKVFVFVTDETDSSRNTTYYLHVGDVGLTEIKSIEGRDLVRIPCYVVFIMSYSEERAKIRVELDATGATAHGYLNFIDGVWVPDDKFRLSIR